MIATSSCLILLFSLTPVNGIISDDEASKTKFQEWKQNFKRNYKSVAEEKQAMKNLAMNMREIDFHNLRFKAGKETYSRGLWELSDLSFEEKSKILASSTFNFSRLTLQASPNKLKSGKSQVNWVREGLVNSVQNQGKCGSCFAFAAVGAAEGVLLRKGIKTRLSVQQIVDCDKLNDGCDGGDPLLAFKYIKTNGISSADKYPYTGKQGQCKRMPDTEISIVSVSRERLNGNENRLRDIVANYGPVVVPINAARTLSNYKSGVYTNPKCPKALNHAVLLVGYGYDAKTKLDYWLVKNSWVKLNSIIMLDGDNSSKSF